MDINYFKKLYHIHERAFDKHAQAYNLLHLPFLFLSSISYGT